MIRERDPRDPESKTWNTEVIQQRTVPPTVYIIRVTQIWPPFFNFFVLPENFVPFGQIIDLAKDLARQKIFSGRSTNLKIEKSRFFCIFTTIIPYFILFPDTQ